MLFLFRCSRCNRQIEADSSASGQHMDCPHCGAQEAVPFAKAGPGTTVGGFRLERLLGKGGMGEVYLATQLSMGRQVAVKILPDLLVANSNAIGRFLREARLAAQLDHPNAATIYAAGEDAGTYYLAMEFIDGESLDIRLKRAGALDEAEALRIVRKTAEALAYAWGSHRMLHRDLKPANIMVTAAGAVKLVDLGLAKGILEEGSVTMTGATLGTPPYMSPEQISDSKELDPRSDIYSLGTTLYHLLTGKCPFLGTSVAQVFHKVLHELPPPIGDLRPGVSPRCVALVECMMAKNSNDRPRDWAEVIARIEEIQAATSSPAASAMPSRAAIGAAAPNESPSPAWRRNLADWAMRRRGPVALALATLALALFLSTLALRERAMPPKKAAAPPPPPSGSVAPPSGPPAHTTAAPDSGSPEAARAPGPDALPRAPENFLYGYYFGYVETSRDPTFYIQQVADFTNAAVFFPQDTNSPAMLAALLRRDLRVISGSPLIGAPTLWFAGSSRGIPVQMNLAPSGGYPPLSVLERYVPARKRLLPESPVAMVTTVVSWISPDEWTPFPVPESVDMVVMHSQSPFTDEWGARSPDELRAGVAALIRRTCAAAGGRPVIVAGVAVCPEGGGPLLCRTARPFVAGVLEGGAAGILWWNVWAPEEWSGGAVGIPGLLETHRQIARELGVRKLPADFFRRILRPLPEHKAQTPPPNIPEANDGGLWFDGKDDSMAIPSFIYDGSHPITVELVARCGPAPPSGFGFAISSTQSGGLWIARAGQVWSGAAHDGTSYREIRSGAFPADRQTHVAIVLADGMLRLYVDGIPQAEPQQVRQFCPSFEPFMVGADPTQNAQPASGKRFQGSIEEVRVSKVARYAATDFAPRIPMPVDRDTILLLRFEEGEGEVAHDASGNGHDGFILGARWHRVGQPPTE